MSEQPMGVVGRCVVPESDDGAHLDRFVVDAFPHLPTRSSVRKAVKRGEILVDGAPARSFSKVRAGQRITALSRAAHPHAVLPMSVDVVYEDDHLAIVDKPPGLPVNGNHRKTVENALPHNLGPSPAVDALSWPRPAHRLDVPTSGLLLVARTASALSALSEQLHRREVHKRYRAVLVGRLDGEGEIDAPVSGRAARSRYRVVGHTPSLRCGFTTTVDLWPVTGRTHQLRRHMAGIGHPILGDALYGLPGTTLRGKGLFLRAVALRLAHPATGDELAVEVPELPKFEGFRQREVRRWRRHHEG